MLVVLCATAALAFAGWLTTRVTNMIYGPPMHPIHFHGKVLDYHGAPVAGAEVWANIGTWYHSSGTGFDEGGWGVYDTERVTTFTDANGRFEVRARGVTLNVVLLKKGILQMIEHPWNTGRHFSYDARVGDAVHHDKAAAPEIFVMGEPGTGIGGMELGRCCPANTSNCCRGLDGSVSKCCAR
jgi:hypothetical protein